MSGARRRHRGRTGESLPRSGPGARCAMAASAAAARYLTTVIRSAAGAASGAAGDEAAVR